MILLRVRCGNRFLARVPGDAFSPYVVLQLRCHSDTYASFLDSAALTRSACEDIMQNITPPPFFLALPGEPPILWQKWKKIFLTYMRVCGSNLSSERKTCVLQHCLGAEGQEILETLPAITTSDGAEGDNSLNEFKATLLRLDKHFLPKVSIILQRYYFGKRKQTDDESIEDFVTALRKLASSCNFGENLEERIKDQFMLECKCDKVREALWPRMIHHWMKC
ncbi:hypothetical protein NDU88_001631 [Pleurodeles waltl]|uniref:Uncharacterized protein n=1 Tax=Pleurodeles waltl TaxID=8319 RepID=A0AAV7LDQ4_PLEWA|nr:hypothetical protein NDU88_001631 [Pleurodeles waltl]